VSTISKNAARTVGEDLKTHVTYLDCFVPRTRHPDSHVRFVDLSCGSEHAPRGASPRTRRDIDDPVLAVRERSGGPLGLPLGVYSYALLPISYGFGPVRRIALTDVVFEDRWGQPYRD
jgi:hypothetical protein